MTPRGARSLDLGRDPGHTDTRNAQRARSLRVAPPSPCQTPQLTISLTHSGGGLGHVTGYLRFLNTSRVRCSLSGWPTVTAVEPGGKTVRSQGQSAADMWGLNWPARRRVVPLVLRPGRSGYVGIAGGDNPAGGGVRTCPKARWLRVSLPGAARSSTISAWVPWLDAYFPLCSGAAVTPFISSAALRDGGIAAS